MDTILKRLVESCKNKAKIKRSFRCQWPVTQVYRFSNCKLAVQSKLGPQRLAQHGYSNVHRWGVSKVVRSLAYQDYTKDVLVSVWFESVYVHSFPYFYLHFCNVTITSQLKKQLSIICKHSF